MKCDSYSEGKGTGTTGFNLAHRSLEALLDVTRTMGVDANVQSTLDSITKNCLEVFNCQQVSIMLLDDSTRELRVRSQAGEIREGLVGRTQKVGEGIAGKVAEDGKPLVLGKVIDREAFRRLRYRSKNISAAMVVPITSRGSAIGVLNITRLSHRPSYRRQDLQILYIFAEIVAVCIQHAQQIEWMKKTIRGMDPVHDHESVGGERKSA